jgi:hypothetical protein
MSYNLMVFRKDSAPKTRTDFMKWYEDQTEWKEGHDYNDPATTTTELREWYMEMIQTFPAMNGPFASKDDVDDPHVTDYSVGKDSIYAGFSFSVVEEAYATMLRLAEKYGVGVYDVGRDGDIFFPESGGLKAIDNPVNVVNTIVVEQKAKPWWKLW